MCVCTKGKERVYHRCSGKAVCLEECLFLDNEFMVISIFVLICNVVLTHRDLLNSVWSATTQRQQMHTPVRRWPPTKMDASHIGVANRVQINSKWNMVCFLLLGSVKSSAALAVQYQNWNCSQIELAALWQVLRTYQQS